MVFSLTFDTKPIDLLASLQSLVFIVLAHWGLARLSWPVWLAWVGLCQEY